jgi:hypothetical protein
VKERGEIVGRQAEDLSILNVDIVCLITQPTRSHMQTCHLTEIFYFIIIIFLNSMNIQRSWNINKAIFPGLEE